MIKKYDNLGHTKIHEILQNGARTSRLFWPELYDVPNAAKKHRKTKEPLAQERQETFFEKKKRVDSVEKSPESAMSKTHPPELKK